MNTALTDWLNKQKPWLKLSASLLLEKSELSEEDISLLRDIIKGTKSPPPFNGFVSSDVPSETKLQFLTIGSISGIDRLNPHLPLAISNPRMTIIYGANGSGKSSYVRLLKELTGTPNIRPLKYNVFTSERPTQRCELSYSINGLQKNKVWQYGNGVIPELRGVDIFDNLTGTIYIDNAMEVAYAPSEVLLLTRLVEVCKQVERLLENERNLLVSSLPSIPQVFSLTKIAEKYKNPAENEAELTAWSAKSEKRLSELEVLLSTNPEDRKKTLEVKKRQTESIQKVFQDATNCVSPETTDKLLGQIKVVDTNRKASNDAAIAFNDIALLDGVASDSWKKMWNAARQYSELEAYKSISFPNVGKEARCVLCNQVLDEQAQKRFVTFESFIKGSLSTTLTESEELLSTILDEIVPLPDEKKLETMFAAAGLPQLLQERLLTVKRILDPILITVKSFSSSETGKPVVPTLHPEVSTTLIELEKSISALDVEIKALSMQINPIARKKLETEADELKALRWTSQQTTAIQSEINRRKQLVQYEMWIRETGTRAISLMAGDLATDLITAAFTDRFNQELATLGAKNIQVEIKNTQTRLGKPQYRLSLRGLTTAEKLGEILSEGELRIVALAAFLADVTGKQSSTPFIFDDPISSLDQRYEEKTAKRLAQLSFSQQVIVFTHRLSFLNLLLENQSSADVVGLKVEPWGTGEPGELPISGKKPQGALNTLKCERLQQARKSLRDEGSESYYIHVKAICSDFRSLIERIVEQELLADVIVRHRRDVQTKKIEALSKITIEDCKIIDEMMTKYSAFEHSQSDESPVETPDPDDIESDINRVLNWLKTRSNKTLIH